MTSSLAKVMEFQAVVVASAKNGPRPRISSMWTSPQNDWCKLNTDGSVSSDNNRTGAGGLIRDVNGG